MKKKIIPLIIGLCALIIVNFCLLGNYKKTSDIKFIVEPDSYSDKYARNNDLEVEYVSDSNRSNYIINITEFAYTTNDEGITITKYNGIDDTVVIPNKINGIEVIGVKKDVFKNTQVKKVYIGSNITKYEDTNKIEIICYNNNYCDALKENKDLNVNIIDELDNINFDYIVNEFEYNIHEKEIELTKYNGNSKNLIIPSTINGYKVTSISFSLENIDSIYFSKDIKGILNNNFKYDNNVFMAILLNIISYLICALVIILILNKDEIFYQMPTYVISILYLGLQFVFSNKYIDIPRLLCMYCIILSVLYITFAILLRYGQKKIKETDNKIKKYNYVNDLLDIIEDLKIDKNKIKDLIEDIKYSDPISNINTKNIEQEIVSKLKELDNSKDIEDDIKKLKEMLIKRNNICKRNKGSL